MRPHGKTKLGFFPLPAAEAARLKNCLAFASEFSALDPCVGDGVAFTHLLHGVTAHRYGIEIDANRAEQARALGIETVAGERHGCPVPAGSGVPALPEPSVRLGMRRRATTRDWNWSSWNTAIAGSRLVACCFS